MADESLAKMKAQVYYDERPAEFFEKFHARARRRGPDWVYEAMRIAMMTFALVLFRIRSVGSDNVPKHGAVILAPNHFSYMDHFFLGLFIRRKLRFMAKSQLFKWPLSSLYKHGGVFPVRRGSRDDEAFVTARKILSDGGCVAMYCEGGRSRTGKLAERAKPGIGRLALESGATIVPVAIYGSSHVRNWKKLRFPRITVEYGEPFRYPQVEAATRDQRQATSDAIFDEIKTIYRALDSK
jgi:1-acyl-sn-glycerol-3-phosphate acyltransferase